MWAILAQQLLKSLGQMGFSAGPQIGTADGEVGNYTLSRRIAARMRGLRRPCMTATITSIFLRVGMQSDSRVLARSARAVKSSPGVCGLG